MYKLQTNQKFKKSFEFIKKQLEPFNDFLFYLPEETPTALPIEVKFEEKKSAFLDDSFAYKLISIKHAEVELLVDKEDLHPVSVDYDSFIDKLCRELCIPKNQLRISTNIDKSNLNAIHMPWQLRLSKKRNENR